MTYQQFCAVMRREKRTSETELMQAFRAIDTSGDGYITADELHRMLTKVGACVCVFVSCGTAM